jgi:DNA polymerase I-like protein with 3'-5' exonuclease and polymerase domains
MWKCDHEAKTKGLVRTEFGRIRHLPRAKELFQRYGKDLMDYKWATKKNLQKERRELKNLLNNAKNFPIQGMAGHIVNRSMIAAQRAFRAHNIDGWLGLQVHDENVCIVREDQAELASQLLRDAMETTTKISVPLKAEPLIADNWAEAK